MVFKSFVWPHNPKNINISIVKNSNTLYLPGLGPFVQQIGKDYKIIYGSGEFFGKNALTQFNQLSNLFSESSLPGKLLIPPIEPINAYFCELAITNQSNPEIIPYKFKFIEDTTNAIGNFNNNPTQNNKFYYLKNNETLWDVANKFNINIDSILNLNPNLSNPYDVKPNLKVLIQ